MIEVVTIIAFLWGLANIVLCAVAWGTQHAPIGEDTAYEIRRIVTGDAVAKRNRRR